MSSILFYSTRKSNILRKKNFKKKLHTQKMERVARRGPLARAPGALKGGLFRNCQHFCRSWRGFVAKHQKIEKWKTFYFRKKISVPKKTERGTFWDFSTSILSQNIKKNAGGTLWGNFFFEKKVSQCRKNERGESLVSPGMLWYAGKQEKPFWFSSLD